MVVTERGVLGRCGLRRPNGDGEVAGRAMPPWDEDDRAANAKADGWARSKPEVVGGGTGDLGGLEAAAAAASAGKLFVVMDMKYADIRLRCLR